MAQTALSNLGINYDWEAGEDGWKDGMDLNLLMLDAFGQAVVVSQVDADPWISSSNPAPGKMYIVGTSPTGATAPWNTASASTIANKLAIATGNNAGVTRWHMVTPKNGWTVYNQASRQKMTFKGLHGSGGVWITGESGIPSSAGHTVLGMHIDSPPGSPAAWDMYVVGTGAGAWSGWDDSIAVYDPQVSTWLETNPVEGMRVKLDATGEYWYYNGTGWVQELQYLSANSRSFKIIDLGNDGVGPFSADRAAPSYTMTREETSAQMVGFLNGSMLGSIDFTNTAGGSIAGTGTLDSVGFAVGAPEETWTLTCTAGGPTATFSVVGSVSGTMANATVGTPYDNGVVSFTLTGGGVDFSSTGNADRIVFTAAYMPIEYDVANEDVIPAMIGALASFNSGPVVKIVAGAGEITLKTADGFDLFQVLPSTNLAGSLLAVNYSLDKAGAKVNEGVDTKTGNYTLKPGDEGKLIVMDTTGGNLTLTIPESPAVQMLNGAYIRVFHKGGNTLTISGAGGVTLTGTTAGTQNKTLHLERDTNTNDWFCG